MFYFIILAESHAYVALFLQAIVKKKKKNIVILCQINIMVIFV